MVNGVRGPCWIYTIVDYNENENKTWDENDYIIVDMNDYILVDYDENDYN